MGLLGKVFGKGDTTLDVTVEPDRIPVGGEVAIRWEVGGELDEKARAIRAGVTATGWWEEHDRNRDTGGSHRERRSMTVWEDTREFPAALGPGAATIAIPADAPPGSKDVLKWEAWVAVDRERGRDHVQERTIYVRRPEQASAPAEVAGDGLTLRGVPAAVRLGRTYDGTLDVTPADDVSGTVRVRLFRRVTHVARRGGDLGGIVDALDMPKLPGGDLLAANDRDVIVEEETVTELSLTDKQDFAAGATRTFPFQLEVPSRGPTTEHDHARVQWRLEAVLDRRMRGDLRVALDLDVS